jgi:hypothetical protein
MPVNVKNMLLGGQKWKGESLVRMYDPVRRECLVRLQEEDHLELLERLEEDHLKVEEDQLELLERLEEDILDHLERLEEDILDHLELLELLDILDHLELPELLELLERLDHLELLERAERVHHLEVMPATLVSRRGKPWQALPDQNRRWRSPCLSLQAQSTFKGEHDQLL